MSAAWPRPMEDLPAARSLSDAWTDQQFRALVTASSSVLYRMNADWSEMRHLGSTGFLANTDQPTNAWLEKYIPPHERPRVLAAIQHAVRTRSVFELEHQVVPEDGTVGWTLSRAVPVIGTDGEVIEWFGAADDVTARRDPEEQRCEATCNVRSTAARR